MNTRPHALLLIARALAPAALAAALLLAGCESSKKDTTLDTSEPAESATSRISRARALAIEAANAEADGRTDEAIRLNQQAIAEYPDFAAAWNNLGVLYMNRKQNLEAVSAFQRAGELSPDDARFPYNIGVIWWHLGYWEDAAKQFNLALDRDPNYLPALRYSIQWDVWRGHSSEETAQRLRRALLAEQDPQTREWLLRQQLLVSEALSKQPPQGVPPVAPSNRSAPPPPPPSSPAPEVAPTPR